MPARNHASEEYAEKCVAGAFAEWCRAYPADTGWSFLVGLGVLTAHMLAHAGPAALGHYVACLRRHVETLERESRM